MEEPKRSIEEGGEEPQRVLSERDDLSSHNLKDRKNRINQLLGECGSFSSDIEIKPITSDQAEELVDLASEYAAARAMKQNTYAQQICSPWGKTEDQAVSAAKSLTYLNAAINNPDKGTRIPREGEWADALKAIIHDAAPTTLNAYATFSALSQTVNSLLSRPNSKKG